MLKYHKGLGINQEMIRLEEDLRTLSDWKLTIKGDLVDLDGYLLLKNPDDVKKKHMKSAYEYLLDEITHRIKILTNEY